MLPIMIKREALLGLGQAVPLRAINEFHEDDIWELQVFQPQYKLLTPAQKARWVCLRMATHLRIFLQEVPNQDERDVFVTAFLLTITESDLGITLEEFVNLRGYEAAFCGIGHHLIKRPAMFNLLLGFWGAFVVPQPFTVNELKSVLRDAPLHVIFEKFTERGMSREMELDYPGLIEFHNRFMIYINILIKTLRDSGLSHKAE